MGCLPRGRPRGSGRARSAVPEGVPHASFARSPRIARRRRLPLDRGLQRDADSAPDRSARTGASGRCIRSDRCLCPERRVRAERCLDAAGPDSPGRSAALLRGDLRRCSGGDHERIRSPAPHRARPDLHHRGDDPGLDPDGGALTDGDPAGHRNQASDRHDRLPRELAVRLFLLLRQQVGGSATRETRQWKSRPRDGCGSRPSPIPLRRRSRAHWLFQAIPSGSQAENVAVSFFRLREGRELESPGGLASRSASRMSAVRRSSSRAAMRRDLGYLRCCSVFLCLHCSRSGPRAYEGNRPRRRSRSRPRVGSSSRS